MHAAVVTEFGQSPRWIEFPDPTPDHHGLEVVEVVATALHPRVRSQAAGSHYTTAAHEGGQVLPLIPGIDGVGRRSDGSLVYFVLPDTRFGSMAEHVAIDGRRSIPVAETADLVAVSAAMNPAMSSWVALRRRARMEPGQSVLILGATGSAGQLAVQVAKHLGAGRVVAAGRDGAALEQLSEHGADELVSLAGDPDAAATRVGAAASEVDVVVDYLWGGPVERALPALLTARSDRARRLTWVQVGAVAGPEVALPSTMLRQADVALLGSGQGSVSTVGILEELVPLLAEVQRGSFELETDVRPLAAVEATWSEPTIARRRVVFQPSRPRGWGRT